jgi:hypothetical protein
MDPTSLLTNSAAVELGVAAFRSAIAVEKSVLQLFQPAQYGQVGATTPTRGNLVNIVA